MSLIASLNGNWRGWVASGSKTCRVVSATRRWDDAADGYLTADGDAAQIKATLHRLLIGWSFEPQRLTYNCQD